MTHQYLQQIALLRLSRMGCFVAYPEVYADANCGRLDAAGAKRIYRSLRVNPTANDLLDSNNDLYMVETYGIEVKVSRADYFGRKQKFLHKRSTSGWVKESELGANYRYFLVPKGLIKPKEVYEGWGLMEFDGKRVKTTIKAPRMEVNNTTLLYYMAKVPLYVYHKNKTKLMFGYDWVNYIDIPLSPHPKKEEVGG